MMLSPHSSRTSLILCSLLGLLVGQSTGATIVPGGQYAVVGEDYNLTCAITSPVDKVIWQQGFRIITHHYENCTATVFNGNPRQQYRYLCPNDTHFVIVIQGVAITKERGLMWKCMANNSHSAEFRIDVFSEPKMEVQLSVYNESTIVANQNLTLRCSVDGGYPLANLSWLCNGSDVVGSHESTSDKAISVLTFPVNQSDSGLICTCTAKHPLWQKALTNQTKPLIVLYASTEDPHITGYKSFQSIREGVLINLTCTVSDGYPLPTLTWICDGTVRESKNQSKDGTAEIVLPLAIKGTLNGRQCVCNGTSIANYNRTSNVSFSVLYPPKVTLFAIREQHSNGHKYNMYCRVGVGNPSSNIISWSQRVANTIVRINKDLLGLQSNSGHNLTLTGASYQDIGEYTCSVHNNVIDLNGNLLQNKSVSIQTNFSAVFTFSNGSIFHAIHGKRFYVSVPFYCQPPITKLDQIMWFKRENDEQPIKQNGDVTFDFFPTNMNIQFYQKSVRVVGQVAVMSLKVNSHASKGNYLLKIRNMGDLQEQFQFRIEFNDPVQQTSIPLILGCSVADIIVLAVIVVVIIYVVMEHKTSEG